MHAALACCNKGSRHVQACKGKYTWLMEQSVQASNQPSGAQRFETNANQADLCQGQAAI